MKECQESEVKQMNKPISQTKRQKELLNYCKDNIKEIYNHFNKYPEKVEYNPTTNDFTIPQSDLNLAKKLAKRFEQRGF